MNKIRNLDYKDFYGTGDRRLIVLVFQDLVSYSALCQKLRKIGKVDTEKQTGRHTYTQIYKMT